MLKTKDFRFDLKATDGASEAAGIITGKASVYGVLDSYRDVVMPGAFSKSLAANGNRVVILNQHNTHDPIGIATLTDSADALLVNEGVLELGLQSARDAYLRAKKGLVTGISIGYETISEEFKGDVRMLTEINLWEVSLVTFPACAPARVTGIKSALEAAVGDWEFVDWALAERKAGRVLSAVNLSRMKSAMDAMAIAMRSMQEVIDAAEPAPAGDDVTLVDEELSAVGQEMKSIGTLMADIRRTFTK